MFTRKTVTIHELSPELTKTLEKLDGDVESLIDITVELVSTYRDIRTLLQGEILAKSEPEGIQAFADAQRETPDPSRPGIGGEGLDPTLTPSGLPKAMMPTSFETTLDDDDRVRNTPFTRASRNIQVRWLLEHVLNDHEWHTSIEVAKRYMTDQGHYRYLRHAVAGRFRELWEIHALERRDSSVRGAQHEYRLRPDLQPDDVSLEGVRRPNEEKKKKN